MEVRIQISDTVYTQLLQGNKRIEGSLILDNPLQGNFRAYNKTQRRKTVKQSMKLPHGRITVTEEKVRMHLFIKRDECIIPAQAIEAESNLASKFVEFMEGFGIPWAPVMGNHDGQVGDGVADDQLVADAQRIQGACLGVIVFIADPDHGIRCAESGEKERRFCAEICKKLQISF